MGLFYAAIRRDSVSLKMFPFLSHVQVLSCEILFVYRLKYLYSCFSSHFCFLVILVPLMFLLLVLFLVTVIFHSLFFLVYSSIRRIDASTLSSMLASSFPPSFLDTYCQSTSFLGHDFSCSLVYLSFTLVHFKNVTDYLITRLLNC